MLATSAKIGPIVHRHLLAEQEPTITRTVKQIMLRVVLPALLIAGRSPLMIAGNENWPGDTQHATAETVAQAGNRFGTELYRQLRAKSGNIMISPISLCGAFGPVTAGARGETRDAIEKALRFPTGEPSIHPLIGELL